MAYFNRGDNSSGGRGGGRSFGGGGRNFGSRNFSRDGGRGRGGGDRTMFNTVCSKCGNDCEVPFRPTGGKPVYCSSCFEKMGNQRTDSDRPSRFFDRSNERPQSFDSNKGQFDAINQKLDRIIKLLEPKVIEEVEEVKQSIEKVKEEPKKAKKAAPKTKKAASSKKK